MFKYFYWCYIMDYINKIFGLMGDMKINKVILQQVVYNFFMLG